MIKHRIFIDNTNDDDDNLGRIRLIKSTISVYVIYTFACPNRRIFWGIFIPLFVLLPKDIEVDIEDGSSILIMGGTSNAQKHQPDSHYQHLS